MIRRKTPSLEVINPHAAGLDLGSEKIYRSIAGGPPEVFGTVTSELERLREHLLEQGVQTVAMEATGIYWLSVYEVLEKAGLEVVVVNGKHVRNLPGRKTDVKDCQWLATLHAHGLLRGGFVPEARIRQLQDYLRLRQDHIAMAAAHVQHMQKALERMNIKVHDVISRLTGASGLAIIGAILKGERQPAALAALADVSIRKHKEERLEAALRGQWNPEHLFALRQAYELWEFYQKKIAECDAAVAAQLQQMNEGQPPVAPAAGPRKRQTGANAPQIEGLHQSLRQLCGGCDPTQLPGLADYSVLLLVSEVGTDLRRWPTWKHFTAWLGLAPASHQSGKRRGRVSRQRNRAGRIFCTIARTLARSVDKALGGFYRRLRARRGGLIANQALARKIAILYWRTFTEGLAHVESGLRAYEQKLLAQEQRLAQKLAAKLGCRLVPLDAVHG
jgi:transposase